MTPSSLKSRRKKLNLSQYAVSKLSKIGRFKISTYECGYGKLSESEMHRLDIELSKKEASHVKNNKKTT